MGLGPLVLVLAAAGAHAGWNFLAFAAGYCRSAAVPAVMAPHHDHDRRSHQRVHRGVHAPAREISIVFGVLLGASVLGEGQRRRRALAAVGILAGIALLAAG